jgi:hypothetical protein
MISLAQPFEPTIIKRVDRALPTSACTVVVETDCGKGYLKAIGNEEGPWILGCELIGTRLAEWFGLSTFQYSIIEVKDYNNIRFHNGKHATPGPGFITRSEMGEQWDGTSKQLESLSNPEDIGRLIVFDTWTLNCDRYSQPGESIFVKPRRNQGNVFLVADSQHGGLELKAMDHTHCFTCGRSVSQKVSHIDKIQDPRVFGCFPEFRKKLNPLDIQNACNDLRALTENDLGDVMIGIPKDWGISCDSTRELVKLLSGRGRYVADTIEEKLWPQREFDFPIGDES